MSSHAATPTSHHSSFRRVLNSKREPVAGAAAADPVNGNGKLPVPAPLPAPSSLEKTVKELRLMKALTLPERTSVSEACRKMFVRRVDSALVTDAKGLLAGIVTAVDVSEKVVAEGLRPEQTSLAKIMTRSPTFVMSNLRALEALEKMVQGKFGHLPVVENGEVIGMLGITKFLYDAITKMEKAAEQGNVIALAMEGIEHNWEEEFPGSHALIESLRERLFKPSLSTIIPKNSSVPSVSPSDPVIVAAKKMRESKTNSVVVMVDNKLLGILTAKDVLLRVVAQNLPADVTLVEKTMTVHPDCATLETSILDALHSMQDGKFIHIPVVDRDGKIVACMDVLQLIYAAISMDEASAEVNSIANSQMQNFWNSLLDMQHFDNEHHGYSDGEFAEDNHDGHPLHVSDSFVFKLEDQRRRVHKFSCVWENLDDLVSAASERLGIDEEKPQIILMYEDDEGDKVVLKTDSDLIAAMNLAKSSQWKALKLYVDDSDTASEAQYLTTINNKQKGMPVLQVGIMAGAVALASVGLMAYLRRSNE